MTASATVVGPAVVEVVIQKSPMTVEITAGGLIGPAGAQGTPGATGPQGLTGVQGLTGPAGLQGPTGATGATGAQGPAGVAGPQVTGIEGLDGLSLAALWPTIPPTGTAYYVDPDNGDDGNDGLSESVPWETFDNVATTAFEPGDQLLLKSGEVYNDELIIPTAGAGITVGAWGPGAKPIIDRGPVLTGELFDNGFDTESDAFATQWGGKTEAGSSTIAASTVSPISGTKSMKYTHTSGGTAYATKTLSAAGEVYVQMKVRLDNIVADAAFDATTVLFILGPPVLLYIRHDATPGNGVQFGLQYPGSPTGNILPTRYWQEGDEVTIEVRYKKDSSGGAGDGLVQLWVDGVKIGEATTAMVSTADVVGIRVGNSQNNGGGFGTGTIYSFDDVKVSASRLGARGELGITIDTADDVTIDGIEVTNWNQYAVKLRNSHRSRVLNCYLHDGNQIGILSNIGGGGHLVDNCEIAHTGEDCSPGGGSAIQFLNTTVGQNIVRLSHVHDCGATAFDHGIYSEGGDNIFYDNLFERIEGSGVKTRTAGFVYRNRMVYCKVAAAYTDAGSNVKFISNSAYNCGRINAPVGNSPFVAFWFLNPGLGCEAQFNITTGSGLGFQATGVNHPLIDNNCVTVEGHYGHWFGTTYTSFAAWKAGSGQSTNDLNVDPLYVDPEDSDLRLQSSSTALRKGATIVGNTFPARLDEESVSAVDAMGTNVLRLDGVINDVSITGFGYRSVNAPASFSMSRADGGGSLGIQPGAMVSQFVWGAYNSADLGTYNFASIAGVSEDDSTITGHAGGRVQIATTPIGSNNPSVRVVVDNAGTMWWAPTFTSGVTSNGVAKIDQSGNANFNGQLHVAGVSTHQAGLFVEGGFAGLTAVLTEYSGTSACLDMRGGRDTLGGPPAPSQSGDVIARILFAGSDDDSKAGGARIAVVTTESWSNSATGAQMQFLVNPKGTDSNTHGSIGMTLDADAGFTVEVGSPQIMRIDGLASNTVNVVSSFSSKFGMRAYAGSGPNFVIERVNGTTSAGTPIVSGDQLGLVGFGGANTSAANPGTPVTAAMRAVATQTFSASPTHGGTKLIFDTTPNDSLTRTAAFVLDQDGSGALTGALTVGNNIYGGVDIADDLILAGSSHSSSTGHVKFLGLIGTEVMRVWNTGLTQCYGGVAAENGFSGLTLIGTEYNSVVCTLDLRSARGPSSSVTPSQSGDILSRIFFAGSLTGHLRGVATIQAVATQNFDEALLGGGHVDAFGTELQFHTMPNTFTSANHGELAMTLGQNKNLTVIGNVIAPNVIDLANAVSNVTGVVTQLFGQVGIRMYAAAPTFIIERANGNTSSGTHIANNDVLGNLAFGGAANDSPLADPGGFVGANIQAVATQAWSSTDAGTKIIFETTANSTHTRGTALTLGQDKSATFTGAVSGITTLAITGAFSGVTTITTSGAINGVTISSGAVSGVTTLAMTGALTGATNLLDLTAAATDTQNVVGVAMLGAVTIRAFGTPVDIRGQRVSGTAGAATLVQSGEVIGRLSFAGNTTTGANPTLYTGARIDVTATEQFDGTHGGTKMQFVVTANTTHTPAFVLTLDNDLSASFAGTLASVGGFSVATNKFTVLAASGNTTVAGTLAIAGDVAVATSKFTVAAASGNTVIAGTIAVTGAATLSSTLAVTGDVSVNTNKFTVAASSGNTVVAGTLGVTGAATLSSTLALTGNLTINTNKFTVTAASGNTLVAGTLSVTGHVTVESVTSTGATGTGKFVFDTSPTFAAGITLAGAVTGVTTLGMTGDLTITDADIILSTGTGTKIGTGLGQKIGFHASTPTVQRSGAAQAAAATTAATNVTPYGFTTAAQADAIVTLVNELRAALVQKGLIKGSA